MWPNQRVSVIVHHSLLSTDGLYFPSHHKIIEMNIVVSYRPVCAVSDGMKNAPSFLFSKMLSPSYIFNRVQSFHIIKSINASDYERFGTFGLRWNMLLKMASRWIVWWAFCKAEHQTPWSSLWSADISGQLFCSHLGTTYKKTSLGF